MILSFSSALLSSYAYIEIPTNAYIKGIAKRNRDMFSLEVSTQKTVKSGAIVPLQTKEEQLDLAWAASQFAYLLPSLNRLEILKRENSVNNCKNIIYNIFYVPWMACSEIETCLRNYLSYHTRAILCKLSCYIVSDFIIWAIITLFWTLEYVHCFSTGLWRPYYMNLNNLV